MTPRVVASRLHARDALGALSGLELSLPEGVVGALIGACHDGTSVLASVLGGLIAPSSGSLLVDQQSPWSSPSIRSRIGLLLHEPVLPPLGRVRDLFALAKRLRGESERDAWLSTADIASLMDMRVIDLDRRQRRSVALGLALAVPEPRLLVLHEPLAEIVGASSSKLRALLKQRAEQGTTVLVLTASSHDGAELADDIATMRGGRIDRPIGVPDVEELCPGSTTQVLVWSKNPRQLASELALSRLILSVTMSSEQESSPIAIRGTDPESCGRAVSEVAQRLQIPITAMKVCLPSTEEITAASAGLDLGARYQAAYHYGMNARNGHRS